MTLTAIRFDTARAESDVTLAAAGDTAAFERLYRSHVPKIYSLVRRMIGPNEADEVTQDAFVRAWQKLHTFRGESAFGTWMHRLTVNVVIERRRTAAVLRARMDDDPFALDDLSAPPLRVDLSMDFEQALDRLPAGAREILVLHDVEGYKHREIGDLLGIASGTSKRQLHRARLLMRRHLERTS